MGVVAFRSNFTTSTGTGPTTGLRISKGLPLNATSEFMTGCGANRMPCAGAISCGSSSDRPR